MLNSLIYTELSGAMCGKFALIFSSLTDRLVRITFMVIPPQGCLVTGGRGLYIDPSLAATFPAGNTAKESEYLPAYEMKTPSLLV